MSEAQGVTMAVVAFDVVGSYREFPVDDVGWEGEWWIIDIEHDGAIRGSRFGGVPEAPTHRAARKIAIEKNPTFGEVMVRAEDGGYVAWMDRERMMRLFNEVAELDPPCLDRSTVGFLSW